MQAVSLNTVHQKCTK